MYSAREGGNHLAPTIIWVENVAENTNSHIVVDAISDKGWNNRNSYTGLWLGSAE
jgi:hypothetical protein